MLHHGNLPSEQFQMLGAPYSVITARCVLLVTAKATCSSYKLTQTIRQACWEWFLFTARQKGRVIDTDIPPQLWQHDFARLVFGRTAMSQIIISIPASLLLKLPNVQTPPEG